MDCDIVNWYGNSVVDEIAQDAAARAQLQGEAADQHRVQNILIRALGVWVGKALAAFFAGIPKVPKPARPAAREVRVRARGKQPPQRNVNGHVFLPPLQPLHAVPEGGRDQALHEQAQVDSLPRDHG